MLFNLNSDDSCIGKMAWLRQKVEQHWRRIDQYREDEVGNQLLIAQEMNRLIRSQEVLDHFIYN